MYSTVFLRYTYTCNVHLGTPFLHPPECGKKCLWHTIHIAVQPHLFLLVYFHCRNIRLTKWVSHPEATLTHQKKDTNTGSTHHTMILTNNAFLHRQYIHMFEDHLPQRVGQLIDKLQNCEDIAMNFLVASFCRCAFAAYVKTKEKRIHYGSNSGLHGEPDHYQERSLCLDKFASCFPTLPQKSTMFF